MPLYAYGYREGLLDGYVYTLSELSNKIFDDDYYTSHWEARVMVNGKEVDYHGDFYSWGSYGVKNQNNDDKVNKATLDEDETPKTFDKFPLLLGFVVIISATVTCVVLYSIK